MYFYFGGDNLIILGLFVLASILFVVIGLGAFILSIKILFLLKKIKEHIKNDLL